MRTIPGSRGVGRSSGVGSYFSGFSLIGPWGCLLGKKLSDFRIFCATADQRPQFRILFRLFAGEIAQRNEL